VSTVAEFTPRLSGENSIIASMATVALVVGIYNGNVGPVTDTHATDAGDINIGKGIRKAGWQALAAVAAIALLARDPNIVILGAAAVIVEELCYRHAHMSNPATGALDITPAAYQPAGTPSNLYVVGGGGATAQAG
jgi:hypothetical protein